MRPYTFILSTILCVIIGCKHDQAFDGQAHTDLQINTENDTTTILRIAIDTALSLHHIPDRRFLHTEYFCKDSVILCTDNNEIAAVLSSLFPRDRKLLFMSMDELCSSAIYYAETGRNFPNFLEIVDFEHVNNTYRISFQNTCVSQRRINPNISNSASKDEPKDTPPCVYGMLCGGGFSMRITNRSGTYSSEMGGRWSD